MARYSNEFKERAVARLVPPQSPEITRYWYNNAHKHSGIRYVSPAQRHAGEDRETLAGRHDVYVQAKAAHPRRWARHIRNWNPITVVTLNPEREAVVTAQLRTTTDGSQPKGDDLRWSP